MGTASQLFDIVAPELAANARKEPILELAETRVSQSAFKSQRNYAVALLAAHMLTVSIAAGRASDGLSGIGVASKTEGSLSVSFADAGLSGGQMGDLKSTGYGRQFEQLKRECIMGARTFIV